jgi:tRNA (pseudouridine54-N1)-methyltransferase
MREFIYFSSKARTSGNFDDLMKAGRMDIALHVIINAFFLSHKLRQDTKLHLVFYGPPNPPMHLELFPGKAIPETGAQVGSEKPDISKKDVAGLIKKMLFKFKEGRKTEVWPGYSIEKKPLFKVIEELESEGKTIYLLNEKGENIRNMNIADNPVFVLGDNEGFPGKELRRLKKICTPVSVGNKIYFASQVTTIVNHEIDSREN